MITSASALRIAHRISTEFPIGFDQAATMVETMRRDLHALKRKVDPTKVGLQIVTGRMIVTDEGFPIGSASVPRSAT